jgi:hypothetical protein
MGLQSFILYAAPVAYLLGAIALLKNAGPAQRKPLVLGWLIPGWGHWAIGRRSRAIFFAAQILGLFLAGLWLSDFRCISPFDRHPIWALIQLPGGAMTLVAAAATWGLRIEAESAYYGVGCLYASVACLLNVVALCDLYDLTESPERRARRI